MGRWQDGPRPLGRRLRDSAKSVLAAVLLVILIRATLVQAYHIPSGSMEDTLLEGDFLLSDKLTFGTQIPDRLPFLDLKLPSVQIPGFRDPRPGDLVIFECPEDPSRDCIKRCIAVAGQTVELSRTSMFEGEQAEVDLLFLRGDGWIVRVVCRSCTEQQVDAVCAGLTLAG